MRTALTRPAFGTYTKFRLPRVSDVKVRFAGRKSMTEILTVCQCEDAFPASGTEGLAASTRRLRRGWWS